MNPVSEIGGLDSRVENFLRTVERDQYIECRHLKHTLTGTPPKGILLEQVAIFQFLAFGKRYWHPAEYYGDNGKSFLALDEQEMKMLSDREFSVWVSAPAEYPEYEHGWSVLNRIVDVCLVGSTSDVLAARRRVLLADADCTRQRQSEVLSSLVAWLDSCPLPNLASIAVRGQFGCVERLPDEDIDLLILLNDEAGYQTTLEGIQRFVADSEHSFGRVSWLATVFSGQRDDTVLLQCEPEGLSLDIYVTIVKQELVRVLHGDPAEAASNLAVLKAARPIWDEQTYWDFIKHYQQMLDIRARTSIDNFVAKSHRSWVPVEIDTIDTARQQAIKALVDRLPTVDMWDKDGRLEHSMLSPFVGALILEAIADNQTPAAMTIRGHMVDYLLSTHVNGTWAFAPNSKMQWPADIDDTACVLAALCRVGVSPIGGVDPVALIKAHITADNLVETWIVAADALAGRTNDIDPVVTANALLCLLRLGVGEESLAKRLVSGVRSVLEQGQVKSIYYHTPVIQTFFFARCLVESTFLTDRELLDNLPDFLGKLDSRTLSAVDAAALVAMAAYCGDADRVRESIPRLLAMQRNDGTWPSGSAFFDPGGGRYGSATLTTALAVVSLNAAYMLLS